MKKKLEIETIEAKAKKVYMNAPSDSNEEYMAEVILELCEYIKSLK